MNFMQIKLFGFISAAWLAVVLPTATVYAEEGNRLPVSNLKPLLKRAIDQGSARGVMIGIAADYAKRKFDSDAPIEVDVREIQALPQPGCGRLEVTTRQKDVLENGKRGDKTLRYQLSYCRGGYLLERQ